MTLYWRLFCLNIHSKVNWHTKIIPQQFRRELIWIDFTYFKGFRTKTDTQQNIKSFTTLQTIFNLDIRPKFKIPETDQHYNIIIAPIKYSPRLNGFFIGIFIIPEYGYSLDRIMWLKPYIGLSTNYIMMTEVKAGTIEGRGFNPLIGVIQGHKIDTLEGKYIELIENDKTSIVDIIDNISGYFPWISLEK